MKKWVKRIVIGVLTVIAIMELLLQGYVLLEVKRREAAPGNDAAYDVEHLETDPDSPLTGKTILFLGSSVTLGAGAEGQSFVELFERLDGVNSIKEAKNMTLLADKTRWLAVLTFGNGGSYIKRLQEVDPNVVIDCVVCQLSTNDASTKQPLGEISGGTDLDDFDKKTVTGAMEYIIRYSRDTWGCPVVFYTGSYYESAEYAAMVKRLYELQEKWDIGVIDLYTAAEFNDIEPETYAFYMYDSIHPTKAGYIEWWFPKMEAELISFLETH